MKKIPTFLAGMLTTLLIGSLSVGALAATGAFTITVEPVNIQVNGATFAPVDANGDPVPVFSYNGTTYAPLRALAEAYGLEVGWDQGTKMATVTHGASTTPIGTHALLVDKAGSEISSYELNTVDVTVNGKKVSSDGTIAIAFSNMIYVNVKIVGEALGLDASNFDFKDRDIVFLDGVTFATIRDFSEVTVANVSFDSGSKTVVYTKENQNDGSNTSPKTVCEIGKQYTTDSGYGVTVNSASTDPVKGVPTFTFKYTLKNLTKDQYLSEDTFTICFTDGTSTNQGGIYMDGIYPTETLTKTYSLILNGKTVSCIFFNDGDSFFITKPSQSDLASHLAWYLK